jgi:hypothetical protein
MMSVLSFNKEEQFGNVVYKIPNPKAKYAFFSTKYISLNLCSECGNYRHTQKSMSKRVFCTCLDDHGNDVYTIICKFNHHEKFSKVLDALIFKMYEDENDEKNESPRGLFLEPSRYWHENECSPCSRTCDSCWRYWCDSCKGGLSSMMGVCTYKKCRVGRRNCGLTY